jgi:hypothetical protein
MHIRLEKSATSPLLIRKISEMTKSTLLVEIVMNEMRKLMESADFFANTSHDICGCPGV